MHVRQSTIFAAAVVGGVPVVHCLWMHRLFILYSIGCPRLSSIKVQHARTHKHLKRTSEGGREREREISTLDMMLIFLSVQATTTTKIDNMAEMVSDMNSISKVGRHSFYIIIRSNTREKKWRNTARTYVYVNVHDNIEPCSYKYNKQISYRKIVGTLSCTRSRFPFVLFCIHVR